MQKMSLRISEAILIQPRLVLLPVLFDEVLFDRPGVSSRLTGSPFGSGFPPR